MERAKIYVFGANGMLGRYVSAYFKSQEYKVIDVTRDMVDAANPGESIKRLFVGNMHKGDVVINCMGTIKPRIDELGDVNGILVNSVFPHLLERDVIFHGGHLIHPTTDCVYSGKDGNYTEDDKPDVSDIYGISKFAGEPKNSTVIRTSIIGEEIAQGRSLIEWVKSMKGKDANGYTDHQWNGVTCLKFAQLCESTVWGKNYWKGVKHFYSKDSVSKYELVKAISDVYELNINLTAIESGNKCDRTLSSNEPNKNAFKQSIKNQIQDQKDFYPNLIEKELV